MTKTSVAINLKRKRLEKGYTLDNLADITGYSKQMCSSFETGRYLPTIKYLTKVSELLGCSPFEIIGDEIFTYHKELRPTTKKDWDAIKKLVENK